MSGALDERELQQALSGLAGWRGDTTGITKTYRFADFPAAIAFMARVVPTIEDVQHHPEWTNVYDRLTVVLRTHDADDRVTAKDLDLARRLDAAFAG